MSRQMRQLLTLESPLRRHPHTLRLLESPDSCRESLWKRLFSSDYDKPFIVDSASQRRLQFDLYAIHSAMYRRHPDRLVLAYTRKMMAFLLFHRTPSRILLLGLGGGSLAKFCYRRLPECAITAVEVNPNVIALRDEFRIPADDDRFRVVCADAVEYVARLRRPRDDVILADACNSEGIAPELDALEFYYSVHRGLSDGGVFVVNICGDRKACLAHIDKICRVFGDRFMTLQVKPDRNLVLFALKGRHAALDWEHLQTTATGLKRQFGLDFPRYARRIALEGRQRHWQHAFA